MKIGVGAVTGATLGGIAAFCMGPLGWVPIIALGGAAAGTAVGVTTEGVRIGDHALHVIIEKVDRTMKELLKETFKLANRGAGACGVLTRDCMLSITSAGGRAFGEFLKNIGTWNVVTLSGVLVTGYVYLALDVRKRTPECEGNQTNAGCLPITLWQWTAFGTSALLMLKLGQFASRSLTQTQLYQEHHYAYQRIKTRQAQTLAILDVK